jgi:hypothetical protein
MFQLTRLVSCIFKIQLWRHTLIYLWLNSSLFHGGQQVSGIFPVSLQYMSGTKYLIGMKSTLSKYRHRNVLHSTGTVSVCLTRAFIKPLCIRYWIGIIMEHELCGIFNTHGGNEKCIHNFSPEFLKRSERPRCEWKDSINLLNPSDNKMYQLLYIH